MFIGETLCLLVFGIQYLYKKNTSRRSDYTTKTGDEDEDGTSSNKIIRFNPAIFALPALCDTTATTLLYLALLLVSKTHPTYLLSCFPFFLVP
jgi:hypothetical protein